MATLKVFVSSTCYDLTVLRSNLRNFILETGHEPVLSEFADVVYDPKTHTHDSCIYEVRNCDMLVLVIGSRLGGKATESAANLVDFDSLRGASSSQDFLKDKKSISITQLEVLTAIEEDIPVYTFVENRVLSDHRFYEQNKDKPGLKDIVFPSIDKKETAYFIFEFINFIRHRVKNNSLEGFERFEEIEGYLKRQWSGLFQKLLSNQKYERTDVRRTEALMSEMKDIKAAIYSSITDDRARTITKLTIQYRLFINFINSLEPTDLKQLLKKNILWKSIMRTELKIKDIRQVRNSNQARRLILIKDDSTFFELRYPSEFLDDMKDQWNKFRALPADDKEQVIDLALDNGSLSFIKYINQDANTIYPVQETVAENVETETD